MSLIPLSQVAKVVYLATPIGNLAMAGVEAGKTMDWLFITSPWSNGMAL